MSASKPREFKFLVIPSESPQERELRWDKWIEELQTDGFTIQGTGPDGDYPIRYSFGPDGEEMTFDEWWRGNPLEPFFEVFHVVLLASADTPASDSV